MIDWQQLVCAGLARSPALSLLRAWTPSTHTAVLMYHELARDHEEIAAWTVTRESDFLRQVEYLSRHYDIVTLDRAIARMRQPSGAVKPMAVITFDDGNHGNATVLLPIVETLRIPVTIYIATQQVADAKLYWFDRVVNALQTRHTVTVDLRRHGLNRYEVNRSRGRENWRRIGQLLEDLKSLAPDARAAAVEAALDHLNAAIRQQDYQIEPMSVGDVKMLGGSPLITIGAHSHCHNVLTQLPPPEVEESVRRSKMLLEEWTGQTVEHFAYPNGTFDETVENIVRRAGFRTAVTAAPRLWTNGDLLHCIPRMGIGRYDSLELFKIKLVGGVGAVLPWRQTARRALPCDT